MLSLLGPAVLISVGYMDPGNWATDLAGGSQFGYSLLWVLLASNLMALLLQHLSAKMGLATGLSYPQVCRARFPKPVAMGSNFAFRSIDCQNISFFASTMINSRSPMHTTISTGPYTAPRVPAFRDVSRFGAWTPSVRRAPR